MTATLTKVTLPTTVVRDVVSRAAKGSTMVDLAPLTSVMSIVVKDGILSVKTTDNTNFLTAIAEVNAEDFEVVVETKEFSQIISKITSVNITFIIEGNKLTLEANGVHNVSVARDTDGSNIVFDEPKVESLGQTCHVTNDELKSITSLNKSCKSEKNEVPVVSQYYYAGGGKVLTTNMYKACSNPVTLTDSPTLISSFVMDLVSNIADEEGVDVYQNESHIVFESTKGRLTAVKVQDVLLNQYPAAALNSKMETMFNSAVQVNRTMLVQALDRICVFVKPDRQNIISLTFKEDGVSLFEASTKSSELLKYVSIVSPLEGEPVVSVNAQYLKNELMTCNKEDITIRMDARSGLQIICGDVKLLLAALNDVSQLENS